MRRPFRCIANLATVASVTFVGGPAFAEGDVNECVEASTVGQKQRDEGNFLRAKESFIRCAQDECPGPVRTACLNWLNSVNERIPSIVVRATAGGEDLADVRVYLDGELLTDHLDGRAFPMNPGSHKLRVEASGYPPIDKSVLLREREANRVIEVSFRNAEAKPPPAAPPKVASAPPSYTLPLVLGAIGIAGIGTFAYTSISGKSDIDGYEKCKPNCNQSDVDATQRKMVIGEVALGVGVVSLGVATVMVLTTGKTKEVRARAPGVDLSLGLGTVGAIGRF